MESPENFRIDAGAVSLSAVVHLPLKTPAPVIVCCHGMLSLKASPKYLAVGEEMSREGYCVLRFDFSGCGDSPARKDETLLGARRQDLAAVLDYAARAPWSDGRMALFGSSLGGYLSLLAAAGDPARIQAIVSWAAPYDVSGISPDAYDMEGLRDLFPEGFRLGEPRNLESLRSVARVLLIHGQEDRVVDWHHALEIYDRLQDPKNLLLMRTADHQFLDPEWRQAALRSSRDWFMTYFPTTQGDIS